MNLSGLILRTAGWRVRITVPNYDKCIICVAPHTSNWDFVLGELAYRSVGRRAGFLMKSTWFFWPLGPILRAVGGVAVDRSGRSGSLTEALIERFDKAKKLQIAITPEGTRSLTRHWRTGFLTIARQAHVPVVLGAIDAATKTIVITDTFTPTGDNQADLRAIKDYYKDFKGIHPEKFSTEDEHSEV